MRRPPVLAAPLIAVVLAASAWGQEPGASPSPTPSRTAEPSPSPTTEPSPSPTAEPTPPPAEPTPPPPEPTPPPPEPTPSPPEPTPSPSPGATRPVLASLTRAPAKFCATLSPICPKPGARVTVVTSDAGVLIGFVVRRPLAGSRRFRRLGSLTAAVPKGRSTTYLRRTVEGLRLVPGSYRVEFRLLVDGRPESAPRRLSFLLR